MGLSKCISVAQRVSSCVRSVKDHQCHVSIMIENHPLNSDVCHVVNDHVMTLIKNYNTRASRVYVDGRADASGPFFTLAVSPVKQTVLKDKAKVSIFISVLK